MSYGLPNHGDLDWDDDLDNSVEALHADVQTAKADALAAKNDAAYAKNIVNSVSDISNAVADAEEAADTATTKASLATGAASSAQSYASQAQDERVAAEAARDAAEAVGSTNDAIIAGRINTPASLTATALTASFSQRWKATTAYTAGDVVTAPDGSIITRIGSGTSRGSFDATEQAAWAVQISKVGTLAQIALAAAVGTADRTQSRLTRLRSILNSPGAYGTWYVQKVDSNKNRLLRDMGAGKVLSMELAIIAPQSGTDTCHQLQDCSIGIPMTSIDQEAGSGVTRSGTGWAAATTDANAYGGSYRSSNASTAVVTYTTPSGVTAIGLHSVQSSNGGVAKVTIDGSATAATYLPTAQQLVDAGSIPSTALAASGGPFQPTDRALLLYKSGATVPDNLVLLADGLEPGAHTVVLSATSVTPTGSGNTRLYDSGIAHYSTETPLTSGIIIMPERVLQTGKSAWESVNDYEPGQAAAGSVTGAVASGSNVLTVTGRTVSNADVGTTVSVYGAGTAGAKLSATITAVNTGANTWTLSVNAATTVATGAVTTSQFIGGVHGYESETSYAVTVDGVDPALADGASVMVKAVANIVRRSAIHHPDAGGGATKIADVETAYRIDRDGVTTTRTWTWRTAGIVAAGYSAMMPLNGYVFDQAGFPDSITAETLTAGDNSQHGKTQAPAAYMWDADGKMAAMMELLNPEVAMNKWTNSATLNLWVQDRVPASGLKVSKAYASRVSATGAPVAVAAGEVWTANARYTFARIAPGAAITLPIV